MPTCLLPVVVVLVLRLLLILDVHPAIDRYHGLVVVVVVCAVQANAVLRCGGRYRSLLPRLLGDLALPNDLVLRSFGVEADGI